MAGAKSASPWRQAAKTLPHSQEMFPASRPGWARSVRPQAQRSSSHGCPADGGWQPFGAAARATEPVPSEASPRALAVSGAGPPRRGGESAGAMLAGAIARVDAIWMLCGEILKHAIRRGVAISGPKASGAARAAEGCPTAIGALAGAVAGQLPLAFRPVAECESEWR